jgi:hypothetical protein
LLSSDVVRELLRDTIAIPRSDWTNHTGSTRDWRYVFSLEGAEREEYVIDERAGAFALVFFPDGTYRCVVGTGYSFLDGLHAATDSCINNLRQIEEAKQQWMSEHRKTRNDVPSWDELRDYIGRSGRAGPLLVCPAGGTYTIGAVGARPTCTITRHSLPASGREESK